MADKIAPGELMNEVNALTRERDELRAENKQWRADWLNIEAENERLRAELQECQETLGIAEELL